MSLLILLAATPVSASAVPTSPVPGPSDGAGSSVSVQPTPQPSVSRKLDPSGFSLALSPARLAVAPVDLATTQHLTVINRGQDDLKLTIKKRNFTAKPDGSLSYLEDAPYGAADWVTITPSKLTLKSGADAVVDIDIDVPSQPDLGDHAVAIVVMAPAAKTDKNIKVNRGVAAPVFLTMEGPTDDSVSLTGVNGPRFSARGNVDITATLQSTGTVHRDFRGPTRLSVDGGGQTTPFSDFTVLRGATRVVTTPWNPPLVCICHPAVSFTNADGVKQAAQTTVVVFPWWLAAVIVLIGLGLALLGRRQRSAAGAAAVIPPTVPQPSGA